jgi:hypothetical protein
MMATHLLDVPVMFLDALLKTLKEQLMLSALVNPPVKRTVQNIGTKPKSSLRGILS